MAEHIKRTLGCEAVRLVVMGHCNSEEEGMRHVAGWLQPLFPGICVTFVPIGDPLRSV